jgi:hypothetical protein
MPLVRGLTYRLVFCGAPGEPKTDQKQLADPAIFSLSRADFYGAERFPED